MMTGCLALIKTKSHLACNKMTLGPSENFAGSSRSSSADLSLVPVFTVQHCDMSHLLLLGKFEYTGGPIFKVVLEC